MTQPLEPGLGLRCQELVELVTGYLEGTLDRDVQARFEAHLRICADCVRYVRQMQETLLLLGEIPLTRLTPATKARLVAAFRDLPGDAGR